MMTQGVLAALIGAAAADNLSGSYEGSVPFIIDVTADFDGSGAKADVDVNVKVASVRITCPGETIAEDDSQVTFPDAKNDGDCLGDGIRSDSKDPSKYIITKNSDGTLTYKSDGYPDLKMKKKSLMEEPELGMGIPTVFLEGFLEGFIGDATHLKACVGESVEVAKDAGHLLGHLKSRKWEKVISDLQALVSDAMDDVKACKGIVKDFAPILQALTKPHFKENFLAHDRAILDLMEDELDVCTFGAPDGHKCGKDLGKQVRSIVIGDKLSAELQLPAEVFVVGFLEGFLGSSKHIKACVGQSMKVAKDAGHLVGDLKSRNLNKTFTDLESLVTDAMGEPAACADLGKDLAPFLAAFNKPHFKENFLAHDREILDRLEDMLDVCTFGAPDGHKCGVDAGKEVRSIVIGDAVVV